MEEQVLDFTEKLKVPVRSTETLDEYLALPKNRQAELKDVGGFVGGPLKVTVERVHMSREEIF